MLKNFVFLASLAYTLTLTAACLIKINTLPTQVKYGDKIFHCLAYFILALLWYLSCVYKFNFSKKRALYYVAIGSIVFGIIIEALQGGLTVYRSADVYDIIANTIGVFLMVILVRLINLRQIKKQ